MRRVERRLRTENLNMPMSLEDLIRSQSDEQKKGAK